MWKSEIFSSKKASNNIFGTEFHGAYLLVTGLYSWLQIFFYDYYYDIFQGT